VATEQERHTALSPDHPIACETSRTYHRIDYQGRRLSMTMERQEIMQYTPLLAGRAALVTGASRGIGAATTALLARHGAAVAVNYAHDERAARQVVDAIVAGGGRAIALQADVREREQVKALVHRAQDALGAVVTLILNLDIHSEVEYIAPGAGTVYLIRSDTMTVKVPGAATGGAYRRSLRIDTGTRGAVPHYTQRAALKACSAGSTQRWMDM
jgi:NAD(P)-dependent dehydrogenase (short-subunit alcohol dehydrogenase family)